MPNPSDDRKYFRFPPEFRISLYFMHNMSSSQIPNRKISLSFDAHAATCQRSVNGISADLVDVARYYTISSRQLKGSHWAALSSRSSQSLPKSHLIGINIYLLLGTGNQTGTHLPAANFYTNEIQLPLIGADLTRAKWFLYWT